MNILYLIPPSEGKNSQGNNTSESLSFNFEKPTEILLNATEKHLKCTGKRFEEAKFLNNHLGTTGYLPAIERYSGVMYNAIGYKDMSGDAKKYFDKHFMILSGLYGILSPQDQIANYKLPIETTGLSAFWKETITNALNDSKVDYIIDLLPLSYKKIIDFTKLNAKIIEPVFLQEKNGKIAKISHGVKKIKGEYIKNICESGAFTDIDIYTDTYSRVEILFGNK